MEPQAIIKTIAYKIEIKNNRLLIKKIIKKYLFK